MKYDNWVYHGEVRYYETDRMGVVHHSNYLRLLEDARIAWLRDHLMDYPDMEKLGIIVPFVATSARYKSFLRFGDHYRIAVKLAGYSGVKLQFAYEIYKDEDGKEILCYTATTDHYFAHDGADYRPMLLRHDFPELDAKVRALVVE